MTSNRPSPISTELLDRYLAGHATSSETSLVDAWLEADPGREAVLQEIEAAARTTESTTDEQWSALLTRMTKPAPGTVRWWRTPAVRVAGIASMAVVFIVAGFTTRDLFATRGRTNELAITAHGYRTGNGQHARINLADGTTVVLGPATVLRVAGRATELVGEALFTVSHHEGIPFTVRAGNVTTRVLGTTFAVRGYPDDREIRVAVAEGRVAVGQAVLTTGDVANAPASNAVRVDHDAERVVAWLAFAQRKLVLEPQTLHDASGQLERWLDLDIRVDEEAGHRYLSTTLGNASVSESLDEIARLTRTRYVRSGRVVTFSAE